jgi:hypothetical protein
VPYVSAEVENAPPDTDILQLSGGTNETYTVTLSEPIKDPVMAIVSLGQPGTRTTYDFDSPFTIVSQGVGYWGGSDTPSRSPFARRSASSPRPIRVKPEQAAKGGKRVWLEKAGSPARARPAEAAVASRARDRACSTAATADLLRALEPKVDSP